MRKIFLLLILTIFGTACSRTDNMSSVNSTPIEPIISETMLSKKAVIDNSEQLKDEALILELLGEYGLSVFKRIRNNYPDLQVNKFNSFSKIPTNSTLNFFYDGKYIYFKNDDVDWGWDRELYYKDNFKLIENSYYFINGDNIFYYGNFRFSGVGKDLIKIDLETTPGTKNMIEGKDHLILVNNSLFYRGIIRSIGIKNTSKVRLGEHSKYVIVDDNIMYIIDNNKSENVTFTKVEEGDPGTFSYENYILMDKDNIYVFSGTDLEIFPKNIEKVVENFGGDTFLKRMGNTGIIYYQGNKIHSFNYINKRLFDEKEEYDDFLILFGGSKHFVSFSILIDKKKEKSYIFDRNITDIKRGKSGIYLIHNNESVCGDLLKIDNNGNKELLLNSTYISEKSKPNYNVCDQSISSYELLDNKQVKIIYYIEENMDDLKEKIITL